MFDVAFSELVVIGILALIVLGPKRLPEVARAAGRWMGKIRNFVENAKRDMNADLPLTIAGAATYQLGDDKRRGEHKGGSEKDGSRWLHGRLPVGTRSRRNHDGKCPTGTLMEIKVCKAGFRIMALNARKKPTS